MREQTAEIQSGNALDRETVWAEAKAKMKNWKAPGPDGLPGFWLKVFGKIANLTKAMLWEVVDGERELIGW